MVKTTIQIDGMMCGMCEAHMNDTIRKNFKVDKVTSSHKKGECVVISDDSLGEKALHDAIDPTGYRVLGVQEEPYDKKKKHSFFGRK